MENGNQIKTDLYTDDRFIIVLDKDPKVIEQKQSSELEACNQWLIESKLSLQPGKCEYENVNLCMISQLNVRGMK